MLRVPNVKVVTIGTVKTGTTTGYVSGEIAGMLNICIRSHARGIASPAHSRWTECHAVLLTPLWPTKSHLHAALPSQVAIFEHEDVRSGAQRRTPRVKSTG